MAGRLSDIDVQAILNNRFGGVAITTPSVYYLGLSTGTPKTDGTGVVEPTTGGYARLAVQNTTANWATITTGRVKNNSAAFTMATASASWGVITYFVFYDSLTGGSLRAYGPLDAPTTINSGDTATFAVNSIVITAPSS